MHVSFEAAQELARKALIARGADVRIAEIVAAALVLAEADGQTAHGLSRIPSYVKQMESRKVDGTAEPFVRSRSQQSIEIDANGGFAYPALNLAVKELLKTCKENSGIAMAGIVKSHHCGVAGHPVEQIARANFLGLMFANTPKAMHAFGGKKALFGTNPIAFACPRKDNEPIVVDMSLSVAARGKIVQAAKQGEKIPDTWGVNAEGEATVDPSEVLNGSLNAIGDSKGMALALMVEIFAGAFVNSQFGFQASSFFDQKGSPPQVGQLLICINPLEFNSNFFDHLEDLVDELLADQGVRLPGSSRFIKRKTAIESGFLLPKNLIETLKDLLQN